MEPHFLSGAYRTVDIPPKGVEGRLVASPEQCTAIADALGLVSLDGLTFDYRLWRSGKDRFKLDGTLRASLVQTCVVSLEPIESEIMEEVNLDFWPADEVATLETPEHASEFEIDLEGPEPIEGDTIDIGQLTYETLASSIDPYPRKPGVEFDEKAGPGEGDENAGDSPFAVLRSLKSANN